MEDKYLKTASVLLVEKTDKEEVVITPPLKEDEITITDNGDYKSPIGKGYTEVHVDVPQGEDPDVIYGELIDETWGTPI